MLSVSLTQKVSLFQNWFRTSGDINNSPMSWLGNLQTTIAYQDPETPLSRPGCWAYPDMLEVGRIKVDGQMHHAWNRAHFGAWCVVSAPLILGMDVSQRAIVEPVIDIITNKEAISVNQAWAGHPGALVWSGQGGTLGYPAARKCNPSNTALKQKGWALAPLDGGAVALKAPGGGCLKQQGNGYAGGAGGLVISACNATDPAQIFNYSKTTFQLQQVSSHHCVDVHSGGPIVWMYGCSSSSQNDQLKFDTGAGTLTAAGLCIGVEADDPAGATFQSSLQAWAKPLNASASALLLINPDTQPHDFEVPLANVSAALAAAGKATVRDIWARADLPPLASGAASVKATVPAMDSAFMALAW